MSRLIAVLLMLAVSLLPACGDEVGDNFYNFVERSDRNPPPVGGIIGEGLLVDIGGNDFLFNISLRVIGEVFLLLRVRFENFELAPDGQSALVDGAFYFPEDGPDAAPLAVFEDTVINSRGVMELDLGYVRIEPARSPIKDTAVEVDFRLQAIIVNPTTLCGLIDDDTSAVFQPIQIRLRGVTFGAQLYGEGGVQPENVPVECPPGYVVEPGEPDDGSGEGSGTEGSGDLTPPDVDLGPGTPADITGRFWLQVNINGVLPLDLMAYTRTRMEGERMFVDGALYLPRSGFELPAVGSFTSPVDENGIFVASVRGLRVQTSIVVEGDIVMLASIKDTDFWCGAAGGEIFSPPLGELFDTTFAAVRFPDDQGPQPFPQGFRPDNAAPSCAARVIEP
jgi:hypothetical protein